MSVNLNQEKQETISIFETQDQQVKPNYVNVIFALIVFIDNPNIKNNSRGTYGRRN